MEKPLDVIRVRKQHISNLEKALDGRREGLLTSFFRLRSLGKGSFRQRAWEEVALGQRVWEKVALGQRVLDKSAFGQRV